MFIFKSLVSKFIRLKFNRCGRGFIAWGNVDFVCPKNINVGNNVSMNHQVYINATGMVDIGNNVALSAGCKIITTSIEPSMLRDKTHISSKITIGDNVQVGAGAIILPGVTIANNVIVGAGSVVTKDIPSYRIVVGVPAREIRGIDE